MTESEDKKVTLLEYLVSLWKKGGGDRSGKFILNTYGKILNKIYCCLQEGDINIDYYDDLDLKSILEVDIYRELINNAARTLPKERMEIWYLAHEKAFAEESSEVKPTDPVKDYLASFGYSTDQIARMLALAGNDAGLVLRSLRWIQDLALVIYNSLSKQKIGFSEIKPTLVMLINGLKSDQSPDKDMHLRNLKLPRLNCDPDQQQTKLMISLLALDFGLPKSKIKASF